MGKAKDYAFRKCGPKIVLVNAEEIKNKPVGLLGTDYRYISDAEILNILQHWIESTMKETKSDTLAIYKDGVQKYIINRINKNVK